ncbi:MAG: plasma-membrane proton-efflux P-type ATPase [Chlamydiales bacterium]
MSDPSKGLTSSEAEKILQEVGENQIEEKKKSLFLHLLSFFWGPIPWMIEVAAVLSLVLQRWPDFAVIAALLLINGAIGFFQEYKANNAIEALKQKLALQARVLRDGKWQDIEAIKLVPGDVVFVKLGNIIPADIKLISGQYLSVDQSSLTGESLPVEKKIGDPAYSGTIVKMGEMQGVVTETGFNTFFGKTAKLVTTAKTISHFQKAVLSIGHALIYLTCSIVAFLFLSDLFLTDISKTYGQLLIFLLVLVIAGIPVALPAVLSMTMAIGARKMAKLNAIVSKLISIEELASIDVLCSDKTGTLTQNKLTLGEVDPFSCAKEELLMLAALACEKEGEDAIDLAILASLPKEQLQGFTIKQFIAFDPVKKRAEAVVASEKEGTFRVCKGAAQVILSLCSLSEEDIKQVNEAINTLASKGYRTLGVAKGDEEGKKWQLTGLIPLFDPPREDTLETIEALNKMQIDIKMVTGDHIAIAKEMAKKLHLGPQIISVGELQKISSEKQREAKIEQMNGFAEVFPEHKFEIVKELQKAGHIVGMTGDGVNDAPALKQADVGIAVSGATDAARASSDLILTTAGLNVIQKAVEEARCIFGRMKSYAMYRISETCRLLFFLFLAQLFFRTHPLSAIMIILIALLNDIPIMTIAYDNMRVEANPVKWPMKEVFSVAIGLAIVGVVSTFGLYWIGERVWNLDTSRLYTLSFFAILCGGNLTIYLTRNRGWLFSKPFPDIRFVLATLFTQVVGTFISAYGLGTKDFVGVGWKYIGLSWVYIAIWFGICLFAKIGIYSLLNWELAHYPHFLRSTSKHLGFQ